MQQKNNPNRDTAIEIDLMKLLKECLHYWWLIVICVIAGAGITLFCTVKFVTPTYRSSCSMYINNTKSDVVYDTQTTSNISASQSLVAPYITVLKKNVILSEIARELNNEYTVEELRKMITASQAGSTQCLDIFVTHTDPVEATRIANVIYELVPELIPTIIRGSSAEPLDYPVIPLKRHSPSLKKNTLLGAAIGLVLALLFITLRYLLDVRIKTSEDLEGITHYPVLGRIPLFTPETRKHEGYGYGYGYGANGAAKKEGEA